MLTTVRCLCVQPADTLLSQINKGHGPEGPMVKRLYILGKQAGFSGLFAGLGPRMSKSRHSSGRGGDKVFVSLRRSLMLFFSCCVCVCLVVMTAGLVTGQFVIYKYIKEALHAPPGVEIHKAVSA